MLLPVLMIRLGLIWDLPPFNRLSFGVPGGPYKCSDGEWVFISVGYYATLIPQLCKAIGREDQTEDPRYATREAREEGNHKQEYFEIFREAFLQKPSEHWLKLGVELDIPIVRMNHYKEVSEDPQAWANNYLTRTEFPDGSSYILPNTPVDFSDMEKTHTTHAGALGCDTRQVLAELGYGEAEIQELLESAE